MAKSSLEGGSISRASLALLLLLLLSLPGCMGLPPGYSGIGDGAYKVRSGDTLYSIAFRHGLDYRSLAEINNIMPPYMIYPDQVLRLRGSTKLQEKAINKQKKRKEWTKKAKLLKYKVIN